MRQNESESDGDNEIPIHATNKQINSTDESAELAHKETTEGNASKHVH